MVVFFYSLLLFYYYYYFSSSLSSSSSSSYSTLLVSRSTFFKNEIDKRLPKKIVLMILKVWIGAPYPHAILHMISLS